VRTVELGVQSMADEVLLASARGYTERTVREAADRVRQLKWSLGIQLMAGLPGDRPELFLDSVRKAIGLEPDFFRFYPTLVLRGTVVARHFENGSYAALSLEDAVDWVLPGYDLCLHAGIPVVRMGLHADPALEEDGAVLGGPHHPAFGHLVRCRWWRNRIDRELSRMGDPRGARLVLRVPARHVGDIAGPERANVVYWKEKWGMEALKILADKSLTGMETVLEKQ
ncbi:MAG: hypothetical protein LLG06_18105, partial [Desulfobacteraceae bacterium]|nr:hypothetical protein [Desulfobacteraceae bacterium]